MRTIGLKSIVPVTRAKLYDQSIFYKSNNNTQTLIKEFPLVVLFVKSEILRETGEVLEYR